MKNKVEVKYEVNGEEKVLYVVKPNSKLVRESKLVHSKAFRNALENGAILDARLNDYMREQGVWNDEKEKRLREILEKMSDCTDKLDKGGIKKSKGKELALKLRSLRVEWVRLLTETTALKENTAEGQAEAAQLDFLASKCIVDETGTPIFDDVDSYLEDGDLPHIMEAAQHLASLTSDFDPDWEHKLPENQFLIKYKYVNDDLDLVNEDGQLIDQLGNLIEVKEEPEEKPEPVFFDDNTEDEECQEESEEKTELEEKEKLDKKESNFSNKEKNVETVKWPF